MIFSFCLAIGSLVIELTIARDKLAATVITTKTRISFRIFFFHYALPPLPFILGTVTFSIKGTSKLVMIIANDIPSGVLP